ncbi:MAG TPA: calcium/proton exchanger [Roseiflexaceae bacterium]|nr:calcium/proton exchanger [Roseiflexaceae bacterium]
MKYLRYLLIFVPLAFLVEYVEAIHSPLLVFIFSCIGLIPLAGLLGEATEELAIHTGPKIGGLLNATLGNAAELIITIVALSAGKVDLVKASITGSILGNLLLILGFSLLLGGLRHGVQRFDRNLTGMSGTMMLLAVIGLIIPTLMELVREIQAGHVDPFDTSVRDPALDSLSLGVAAILILLYVLSLIFTFQTPAHGSHSGVDDHSADDETHQATWSVPVSVAILAVSTIAIVFMSEFLVGAVEPVVASLGVSELFLGIILIPLVGNVAEHIVGVQVALKNKMDLSLTISLGSSMQIALFVAPLLVFISLLFGPEMTLFFSLMEVAALGLAVLIAANISVDGESNWLEGAQLLAVYLIVALGFFFIEPGGTTGH